MWLECLPPTVVLRTEREEPNGFTHYRFERIDGATISTYVATPPRSDDQAAISRFLFVWADEV